MGEQVAGADGETWIDGVRADLENDAFAFRAVDVTAFAVNAPHQRQRLYWIAERLGNTTSLGRREGRSEQSGWQRKLASTEPAIPCGLGDSLREGWPIGQTIAGSLGCGDGGRQRHPVE